MISPPQLARNSRSLVGVYHTLVVGRATSNSVAKFVDGISDTLARNGFAQAGVEGLLVSPFASSPRASMPPR